MATAWGIDTAVYTGKFKYVGSEDSFPMKVSFKPDGLKMYVLGYTTNTIYQYSLSIAWDVNTAVLEKSKYVGDVTSFIYGFFVKPDGSKMYITSGYDKEIHQLVLSTPWDIDTLAYEDKFIYVYPPDSDPRDVSFKLDGTKMYFLGRQTKRIYQWTLSIPWNVDTAVNEEKFVSIGGEDSDPRGIFFKPDGLKVYMAGITNDKVYQYLLSVAWEIDTAVYESKFKYVGDEDGVPYGITFKPDGGKMYMVGGINDKVYQYDLPVVPPVGQPFALRRKDRYLGGFIR